MMLSAPDGTTVEAEIDIGRVLDYEKEHPDWSLMDLLKGMDRLRFTDMDLLARLVGFEGLQEFVNLGFTFNDLADVYKNSSLLGFMGSGTEESSARRSF